MFSGYNETMSLNTRSLSNLTENMIDARDRPASLFINETKRLLFPFITSRTCNGEIDFDSASFSFSHFPKLAVVFFVFGTKFPMPGSAREPSRDKM